MLNLVVLFALLVVGCSTVSKDTKNSLSLNPINIEEDVKLVHRFEISKIKRIESEVRFLEGTPNNKIEGSLICFHKTCAPILNSPQSLPKVLRIKFIDSNPIWMATDEYFIERSLDIPERNSKSRFLKGALKPPAIYTEEEIIIAESSFDLKDPNLIRLAPGSLTNVTLSTGMSIFIQ